MGIKSSDLRIGNWVNLCFHHKEGWFAARVTETYDDNTIHTDTKDNVEGKSYYYEGIALTPDILVACGFERNEPDSIFKTVNFIKWEDVTATRFLQSSVTDGEFWLQGRPTTRVWHLHQLQNLFFALTGKELVYTYTP